jgi:hypothetical protein
MKCPFKDSDSIAAAFILATKVCRTKYLYLNDEIGDEELGKI